MIYHKLFVSTVYNFIRKVQILKTPDFYSGVFSIVGMPGFEPGVLRTRIVNVTVTPHSVYLETKLIIIKGNKKVSPDLSARGKLVTQLEKFIW